MDPALLVDLHSLHPSHLSQNQSIVEQPFSMFSEVKSPTLGCQENLLFDALKLHHCWVAAHSSPPPGCPRLAHREGCSCVDARSVVGVFPSVWNLLFLEATQHECGVVGFRGSRYPWHPCPPLLRNRQKLSRQRPWMGPLDFYHTMTVPLSLKKGVHTMGNFIQCLSNKAERLSMCQPSSILPSVHWCLC